MGEEMNPKVFVCHATEDKGRFVRAFGTRLRDNGIDAWVDEELDAAVVKRIEQGTKIIPVVLDDCKVPEVLRATRWVTIKDITNYDAELREIINSIFEYSDKPSLGSPPAYV